MIRNNVAEAGVGLQTSDLVLRRQTSDFITMEVAEVRSPTPALPYGTVVVLPRGYLSDLGDAD